MDAQQFLSEFSHIASAPEGVKRVREMVLSLAFRGNLSEHSTEDASSLLASLESQRANHSKGMHKTRKRATIAGLEHPPFIIPEHWRWLSLSDVGHDWGQKKPNIDFTYIDVSSIDNQRGTIRKPLSILTPGQAPGRARKIVHRDTIIYSTVRPYLLNIALVDQDFEHEPIASTAFAVIHPWEGVLPKYIYYYLRCPYFVAYVQSQQIGMAYPAISDAKFFAGPIPIPPTSEQKRIVTKVDELMALCDKLETQQKRYRVLHAQACIATTDALSNAESIREMYASWRRLESNIHLLLNESEDVEKLKITILELAVHGKLNLRESSVTEATVEHMRARKRDLANRKIIKRETPIVDFPGVNELLRAIPRTWVWCRLNDIASVVRGGSPRPAGDTRFYGGDIPFLKVADVTRPKGMFVEGFTSTIKKEGLKKTREITERTVLLTNSGATLGIPRICTFRTTFNDGIAAFIELADEVFDEYLYFYLQAKSKWLREIASRGQGQPNLNTDIIRAMWFPLPPIAEQRAIVHLIKRLFSICDRLADQQESARTIASAFAASCISTITGIEIKDKEKMKAPKTELVSNLRVGVSPTNKEQAPLTAILARHQGEMSAKALWGSSGLEIDAFYQQLKTEMANGWIVQPEAAYMKEVGTA